MSLIRQQFNDPQWGEYAKGFVYNYIDILK